MNNIKEKFTEYINNVKQNPIILITLLLPPVAVAVILLTAFAISGIYPFGDKCIALCDMHQQVVPLILDFKDILAGKGNLFLNMQNASGMNLFGVMLFFISSPFTFLAAFVPKSDMMNFMSILTLLKMCCCAITANVYFRRCHKKLNQWWAAALSFVYAMSGYAMLFFQNTVWLDVMYFFPLLLISFERLIRKKKNGMLIFCLVGMLVLNFYLSYMVVVFTLLFFGLYLFLRRKRRFTDGVSVQFIIGCFIAALLSSVVWLPSFIQYLSSARGTDVIDELTHCNLFTALYTNFPLLLCSSLIFAVIITFIGRRQTLKSRFYIIMLALTMLPVVIEPINKMWHTGDYMSFPVRYGYITVMMGLIYISLKLKYITPADFAAKNGKLTFIPAITVIIYCVLSVWFYYTYHKDLDAYATTLWGDATSFFMLLSAGTITVILVCYLFINCVSKEVTAKTFGILLSAVLVFEGFFNTNVYICSAAYQPTQYDRAMTLENSIPESDTDFYRIKLGQDNKKYFDANLIGSLGYNSISHYTSLTGEDYMFSMKRMGYSSYWMEVTGNGGTELTDALMSIKYTVEKFSASEKAVFRNKFFTVIENDFYLPLGLVIDNDLSDTAQLPEGTRLQVQEYLASTLLNSGDLLYTKYTPTEYKNVSHNTVNGMEYVKPTDESRNCSMRYQIKVDGKQTLYFDAFDLVTNRVNEHINNSLSVYVNGVKSDVSFPNKNSNGLLKLGTFENDIVTIDIEVLRNNNYSSFGIYGLDLDKLAQLIDNAETAEIEISGNKITGNATAIEGQYLFLSVPYNDGFTATINGEEVPIYRSMGGFMALELKDGDNEIQLTMIPKGFYAGLFISIVGVALLVIWLIIRQRLETVTAKADNACRVLIYIAGGFVLLVIYILPLLLWLVGLFV